MLPPSPYHIVSVRPIGRLEHSIPEDLSCCRLLDFVRRKPKFANIGYRPIADICLDRKLPFVHPAPVSDAPLNLRTEFLTYPKGIDRRLCLWLDVKC